MSNTRQLRAPAPVVAPQPAGQAIFPVVCPWCNTTNVVLTGGQFPTATPEGEPAPVQQELLLRFICNQQHAWQQVYVIRQNLPVIVALADPAGNILDQAELARSQQRAASVAKLIVPGRPQ